MIRGSDPRDREFKSRPAHHLFSLLSRAYNLSQSGQPRSIMTDVYKIMAKYYDLMYSWKDYDSETQRLHKIVQEYKTSPGEDLLEVGCGTGGHVEYLKQYYEVSGLDLSQEMLAIAREKH